MVREKIYKWLLSMKNPDGSFSMNHGGEADIRYFSTSNILVLYIAHFQ